jgi:hypothetical protein
MHEEAQKELRVRLKLVVLELAHHLSVTKTCTEFNVPHSTFCRWKQKYENDPSHIAIHVRHLLKIRAEYQLGALRIRY